MLLNVRVVGMSQIMSPEKSVSNVIEYVSGGNVPNYVPREVTEQCYWVLMLCEFLSAGKDLLSFYSA